MAGILVDRYRYIPPLAASFTHTYGTNSENPTATDTAKRGLVMDFGSSPVAASDNVRAFTKDKTVLTTTYDIILRQMPTTSGFNFWGSGICVSDGTKFLTLGYSETSSTNIGVTVQRWTNGTTLSANQLSSNPMWFYEWLKMGIVAGDPSTFWVSANGTDWIELLSQSQTGFLTYTQVGFYQLVNRNAGALPISGTNQMSTSILYFSDPDIVPAV